MKPPETLSAREREAAMHARCVTVARTEGLAALDQQEAHAFWLAACVIEGRYPVEAARLLAASERYFGKNPTERLSSAEAVRRGWVGGLPRLRDRLIREFKACDLIGRSA